MIVGGHGPTLCVFVSWTESNQEMFTTQVNKTLHVRL